MLLKFNIDLKSIKNDPLAWLLIIFHSICTDFNIFKAPYVIFDISNAPEIVKRIHVWHSSGIEIAILPHPWNRGSEFFTQYRRAKMCENTHTSVQAWVDSNVGVRADDQMLATAISMTYKMFFIIMNVLNIQVRAIEYNINNTLWLVQ